jgi:hypothetical protein
MDIDISQHGAQRDAADFNQIVSFEDEAVLTELCSALQKNIGCNEGTKVGAHEGASDIEGEAVRVGDSEGL